MSKLNTTPRTIFCRDNLDILQGINSDCIDLIYLDPPFNKKKIFTAPIGSSAEGAAFFDIFREEDIKDEWVASIEYENPELHSYLAGVKAFSNRYNYCYLVYMAIRIIECHRVIKETGSIYLHCDPTMSHYLKIVMDCVFGEKNFRNEIVWRIGWVSGYKSKNKGWIRNHDIILYYLKSDAAKELFNKEYIPYPDGYVRRDGNVPVGEGFPIEDTWNCHDADRLDSIMIKSFSREKTGYPTQKSLTLLERIIRASSNEGDMVLDPFCGCATTCIAAEKLNRKWIGIDVSHKAYELVMRRMKDVYPESDMFEKDYGVTFETTPPKRGSEEKKEKGYVYIVGNANWKGIYKVGVAKDPKRRLNSYQTSDPYRAYELVYKFQTPYYKEIEQAVHKKFQAANEWIEADIKAIKAAIKQCENKMRG